MKMINIFGYEISVIRLNTLVENGDIDENDLPEEARETLEEYRDAEARREYALAYADYIREF